jgi:hypothetical protein
MKKAKAHQRYLTSDGRPCFGVTTILGVMAKPALVNWANKIGLDGYEVGKYVDSLASAGTCAHLLIECDITGKEGDYSDFTPNDLAKANHSFKKWLDWKSKRKFELIASEIKVVSDSLQVGGTCDIYAKVDDKFCVIDIKTAKACYSEQRTQAVAYAKILQENGKQVDEIRIIRVGRDEHEGFEDILVGGAELHWTRFLACLELLKANKNLENSGA